MPSLLESQTDMARGVRGLGAELALDAIRNDEIAAARRLQVYRNHYYATLVESLEAAFPVVRRLVGEGFFRQVARRSARMRCSVRSSTWPFSSARAYSPSPCLAPCSFTTSSQVPLRNW